MSDNTGKNVALVTIVGAAGFGLYKWLENTRKSKEGVPQDLTITEYQNLSTGKISSYPDLLDISKDTTVKVFFEYKYRGPMLVGIYHGAIWKRTTFDPHDEFSNQDVDFIVPETKEESTISSTMNITGSILMTPGMYGLYIKIAGIPGDDIFSGYLDSVLRVDKEGQSITEIEENYIEEGWFRSGNTLLETQFLLTIREPELGEDWMKSGSTLNEVSFSINVEEVEVPKPVPEQEGEFRLTLRADPSWLWGTIAGGLITVEPNKSKYNKWDRILITARPATLYRFSYWTIDDEEPILYANSIYWYVTGNHIITAHFVRG